MPQTVEKLNTIKHIVCCILLEATNYLATTKENFCYNIFIHGVREYFKPYMHRGMCPTVLVLTGVVLTTATV